MKKMRWKMMAGVMALMVVAIVGTGTAFAHGFWDDGAREHGEHMGSTDDLDVDAMHQDMKELFENGDYEDLEALRAEYGMPLMRWVDSQEDFEQMQQFRQANQARCPAASQGPARGCGCAMSR